jgi:hypothetical protein
MILVKHCCFVHNLTVGVLLAQTPRETLPPPPSEEQDTQHWERAMFHDRQQPTERGPGRMVGTVSSWVRRRPQN